MIAMLHLLGTFVANLFKSPRRLQLENLFLRHQLNIALRRAPHLRLRGGDRTLLVWMTWLWPRLLGLSRVVQPDTILRWHRAGFRAYWRWKSRGRPGRPSVSRELRELIDLITENGLTNFELEREGFRVKVGRGTSVEDAAALTPLLPEGAEKQIATGAGPQSASAVQSIPTSAPPHPGAVSSNVVRNACAA